MKKNPTINENRMLIVTSQRNKNFNTRERIKVITIPIRK